MEVFILVRGVVGGVLGGVSGGIRANNQGLDFWGGKDLNNKTISLMKASGFNPDAPVSATDANLVKAQETWIPDAPMDNVKSFTTENVPENIQQLLDTNGATDGTPPILANGKFTGKSHMFFNKNLAFRSAKELYYTMVHEFNHVSQHAILKGLNYSDFGGSLFRQLKEYTAYSHSASLGSSNYGGFARGGPYYHLVPSIQNHKHYSLFQPNNFSWTKTLKKFRNISF